MSSSDLSSPTFNSIAAILQTDFRVDPAAISPATALTDLGLDSLALMEFVFAVEDAFTCAFPKSVSTRAKPASRCSACAK